jgi:hypothetical protein
MHTDEHKAKEILSRITAALSGSDETATLHADIEALESIITEVRGAERYRRIANDYATLTSRWLSLDETKTAVMLARTGSEARFIAEAMRETPAAHGLPGDKPLTFHASQAVVADVALVAVWREAFNTLRREELYVALSRGREGVQLYTDDKAGLLEAMRPLCQPLD